MEKNNINDALYDYVNTVNNNYARINENYSIPNILLTWTYKLNEIKNIYRTANLDINDSITGSIILSYVNKIIEKALSILVLYGKKVNVKFPECEIKVYLQKKAYLKYKVFLDEYKELNDAIKEMDIINELTDYIMLSTLSLSEYAYDQEEVDEYINILKEELNQLKVSYSDEYMDTIKGLLKGDDYGIILSKKQ